MRPTTIVTPGLVLDPPTSRDIDLVAEYCRDPLFERYMVTPWPYEREHAEFFIERIVPAGWEHGVELTWAVRERAAGPLLGMIGWRREHSDIGYWMGAPHRGAGRMAEALRATTAWVLEHADVDVVRWWTVLGNDASVRVARAAGYTFTGEGLSIGPDRSGERVPAWLAEFRRGDSGAPQGGWPS
jgi:RimJ/RimL family protein N-acetyltransferase